MMIITFGLVCLTLLSAVVVVKGDDDNNDKNVFRIDGNGNEGESWDEDSWSVQVDGVMGGQSTGRLEFITSSSSSDDENNGNNNVLKFTGDISLDGGGFSSVRRQILLDLNNYDGIVVTLEADNYDGSTPPTGLHLQFSDSTSYYDFSSAFAIPLSTSPSPSASSSAEKILTSVYLPMDSFNRGGRFGFPCRDNCKLDKTNIDRLSVYVLFQEGTFDVRIKSITAIAKPSGSSQTTVPRSFLSPQIQFNSVNDIINLLQSTISSGGSLYDLSYIELCIAMYWSVLNSILNANTNGISMLSTTKVVICSGLNEMNSNNNSKEDQAWTLRYTMDAIIADLQGLDRSTDNNFLPTKKEAELMDVTCVGRTSPSKGTLYDLYGNR